MSAGEGEKSWMGLKKNPTNPTCPHAPVRARNWGILAHTGTAGAPRARAGAAAKPPRPRHGASLPGPRALRGEGIWVGFRDYFFFSQYLDFIFAPAAFPIASSRAEKPPGAERGSPVRAGNGGGEWGGGRGPEAAGSGAVPAAPSATSGWKSTPGIRGALGIGCPARERSPPLVWVIIRAFR